MADFEQEAAAGSGKRSLGAWFPTASVQKVAALAPGESVTIVLFYQYVQPLWSEKRKLTAIRFLEQLGARLNIGGRLRVGREGINATVSGTDAGVRKFTQDLANLDEIFKTTDFKFIQNQKADRAFKDLKVLPVKELVFYGIAAEENLGEGGVHLPPDQYHHYLGQSDSIVVDIRNAYESDIGNFGGQQKTGGATLLVPEVRKSTDFPAWMKSADTKEKLAGKNVLMYCTGGVRCERASAFLKQQLGDSVQGVFQLQGGIEKYLQTYPEGGYWEGKNFVFDKREAIGVGYEEGVGGVVTKNYIKELKASAKADAAASAPAPVAEAASSSSSSKKKRKLSVTDDVSSAATPATPAATQIKILGKCCACGETWDRYIGKKKCIMCGVPVLLCDACLTKKVDKTPGQELKMRCRICVQENITVPASEVEFTKNGMATKKDVRAKDGDPTVRVAASVCKWGGGHATGKKQERQKERTEKSNKLQFKDQPCRFGSECNRPGCWFSHE
jgi:predicted sulfurtransferase